MEGNIRNRRIEWIDQSGIAYHLDPSLFPAEESIRSITPWSVKLKMGLPPEAEQRHNCFGLLEH